MEKKKAKEELKYDGLGNTHMLISIIDKRKGAFSYIKKKNESGNFLNKNLAIKSGYITNKIEVDNKNFN